MNDTNTVNTDDTVQPVEETALQIAKTKMQSLIEAHAPMHSSRTHVLETLANGLQEFEAAVREDERGLAQAMVPAGSGAALTTPGLTGLELAINGAADGVEPSPVSDELAPVLDALSHEQEPTIPADAADQEVEVAPETATPA
jgi:hypothetical protein